jgi:large subunit ribosomal protein L22
MPEPVTTATLRHLRMSAFKVRAVARQIAGQPVYVAMETLQATRRAAALPLRKLLRSAIANAENNQGISADSLLVAECFVDEGRTLKRWRPRARGRATRIRKRTCHVTVVLAEPTPEEAARLASLRRVRRAATAGSRPAPARRSRAGARAEKTTQAGASDRPARAPAPEEAGRTEEVNEEEAKVAGVSGGGPGAQAPAAEPSAAGNGPADSEGEGAAGGGAAAEVGQGGEGGVGSVGAGPGETDRPQAEPEGGQERAGKEDR